MAAAAGRGSILNFQQHEMETNMKDFSGKALRYWLAGAALVGMVGLITACGGSDSTDPQLQAAIDAAERAAPAGKRSPTLKVPLAISALI